jgi:hypothetical protein
MKSWLLERLLWIVAVGATALMVAQMLLASRASLLAETPLPAMRGVLMYDADQMRRAADSVAATDPFRLERRPSRQTLAAPTTAMPSDAMTSGLHLELSGVSGGPPWRAIVSGIPGHDGGVVVNAGDTLGGIRFRTIRRDTVIAQTKDSTITFTLKR